MITIDRPGKEPLELEYVLIDFEGTLASDRRVHPKAKDKINLLSKRASVLIFVKGEREVVEEALKKVKAEIIYLSEGQSSARKLERLRQSGEHRTVAIGNGADDASFLEKAGLGICVVGKEGASGEALRNSDLVFTSVLDALDFLLKPLRQKATLGI